MLILGQIVGSYDLSVILQNREMIQESPYYVPALILILLGCFTKSAQFLFISGCRTRWPHLRLSRRICTPPRW